jgi:hypothetical protein
LKAVEHDIYICVKTKKCEVLNPWLANADINNLGMAFVHGCIVTATFEIYA